MKIMKTYFAISFLFILVSCTSFLDKAPYYTKELKKYSEYNYDDNKKFPDFTYNNSKDINLKKLKDQYKLDEVAGNGSEIERIKNILKWSYLIVKFDGSTPYKSKYNAQSILKNCSTDGSGIHCGGQAIILVEALQSLDLKARRIVCYSSDFLDPDCHSIVIVYSKQYNKWLFLDSSYGIYLTDENNIPLSIEEIRNAFVKDETVYINSSARNGEDFNPLVALTYYKNNFVRFQSWVNNGFNYNTKSKNDKIELRPINFVDKFNIKDNAIHNQSVDFYTNNPQLFWMKPE